MWDQNFTEDGFLTTDFHRVSLRLLWMFNVLFFCRCWTWQAGWKWKAVEYNVMFWDDPDWEAYGFGRTVFTFCVGLLPSIGSVFGMRATLYITGLCRSEGKLSVHSLWNIQNAYVVLFSFQYDSRMIFAQHEGISFNTKTNTFNNEVELMLSTKVWGIVFLRCDVQNVDHSSSFGPQEFGFRTWA